MPARMRKGPLRRTSTLIAAVFVLGTGLGALAIALTRHASTAHVVIAHSTGAARMPVPARSHGRTGTAGGSSTAGSNSAPTVPPASAGTPHGLGGGDHGEPGANATQSTSSALLTAGARASFAALAGTLGGQAGLAVAPLGAGAIQTLGALQDGHAWSTMKVPVLTTLLADDERSEQTLTPEQQTDATLALEESDNVAAEALFTELERVHGGLLPASEAVQQTLADAGDLATHINTAPNDEGFTTWGQSLWSPSGEVRFYRTLARGCLLDSQDSEYVLGLMRKVIPAQRWGAGEAGYPSTVALGFKGGWGPQNGGGYLVRQTAIVGSGRSGYVLSMIALPSGGAFTEGTAMLTTIASWVRRHLPVRSAPPAAC